MWANGMKSLEDLDNLLPGFDNQGDKESGGSPDIQARLLGELSEEQERVSKTKDKRKPIRQFSQKKKQEEGKKKKEKE
jgi:hypothetical protein